jgi:hypothetical protein
VYGVIQGTWGAWAVEFKSSGPVMANDVRGILEFCRRHPRFRLLIVTGAGEAMAGDRYGEPLP